MQTAQKSNGIVYTPPGIARMILNEAALREQAIPVICDPACGDGALLAEAARRLCTLPRPAARAALRKLTGFDIDANALAACRERLDETIRPVMGRWKPDWKLAMLDVLSRKAERYKESFTHIIGNPPYVRVQHLEETRRKLIREHWTLGSGATDLFIIFFEAGLELLRPGGRLAFITPSSWMRSQAGAALRETLTRLHDIRRIIDFGDRQMFDGVTTYTAITSVSKRPPKNTASPIRVITSSGRAGRIQTGETPRSPWGILCKDSAKKFAAMKLQGTKLSEIADIRVGIQTLADRVFILPVDGTGNRPPLTPVLTPEGEHLLLESRILRPIIKASVAKLGKDVRERVLIYPYDNKGQELTENQLRTLAPRAYRWLRSNRDTLLRRDKGTIDPERWFLFGRRVSITSGFGEKIITSGINPRPNFQHCRNPKATFYSGYAVKPKKGISAAKLLRVLNSPEMALWIESTSRPLRNGWYSYAKSHIQDFPVQINQVAEAGQLTLRRG